MAEPDAGRENRAQTRDRETPPREPRSFKSPLDSFFRETGGTIHARGRGIALVPAIGHVDAPSMPEGEVN